MELYGKKDANFGDMGDFTGEVYIPLDFNSVVPLLDSKMVKCFSICENSFEKLLKIFKLKATEEDLKNSLLILMRVKKGMNAKKISKMGWKISNLLSENSIVVWTAQAYDKFRFDFYFYEI